MVIFTNIWQKLNSVECNDILIVIYYWQLLSRIFGETLLIVTYIWRNLLAGLRAVGFRLSQDVVDESLQSLAAHVWCAQIRLVALTAHVA